MDFRRMEAEGHVQQAIHRLAQGVDPDQVITELQHEGLSEDAAIQVTQWAWEAIQEAKREQDERANRQSWLLRVASLAIRSLARFF